MALPLMALLRPAPGAILLLQLLAAAQGTIPDVTLSSNGITTSAPEVTTVNAPDVTTVSAPDVTTVSAPDVTTVSAPDVTTISAPDTAAAADTTTAATTDTTTESQVLWVAMLFRLRVDIPYEDWMADENSSPYQQLASDAQLAATPPLEDEFGEDHVITEVIEFSQTLKKTIIRFNTTVKTTATKESDIPLRRIESQLKTAIENIRSVADSSVSSATYDKEHEVIMPFTIPQTAETTVREKRSTTAVKEPTTGPESTATTASTTGGATTPAEASDQRPTAAPTAARTTAATTVAAAGTTTTAPANTATDAAKTTTVAAKTTTVAAKTTTVAANTTTVAANTITVAANTTTVAANTTTVAATTTAPTTTETPQPVSAQLSCEITLNMEYVNWMSVSFTPQYAQLKNKIEQLANYVLTDKFGDNLQGVDVKSFQEGVVVAMEVTVLTNKTRAEDVDAKTLAKETTAALQQLIDEDGFTFDPSAVHTSEEIVIIEPTTPPPPTEYPYRYTIMRFTARAPFANYSEELNDTESEGFADMEEQIQEGAELMLSKKFPKSSWNVSSSILWMTNATEEVENAPEQLGVTINFLIKVEPQVTNTSQIVKNLATSFVHFNKLGKLQIAPDSLKFKDLTDYAPGKGVVIMDEDYLRELRKTRYNGSYIGDYTTPPPTLRPVVKRHSGLVLGIAVPAFIGMIAAIGLLLICTTIAGAKKSDD